MKIKKLLTLFALPALMLAMSSCDDDTVTADAERDAAYVEAVLGYTILYNTSSGTPMVTDGSNALEADSSDTLTATTSYVVSLRSYDRLSLTVSLEWSWDESYNDYISSGTKYNDDGSEDETAVLLSFNYDDIEGGSSVDVVVNVTATLFETTGTASFTLSLNGSTLEFDAYTIEQLYNLNDDESSTYYGKYFWLGMSNNNSSYYYVSTRGYIVTWFPDGNQMLIADGDYYMIVYSGSGTALLPSNYPAISEGALVEVKAETAGYYGSPQLAYVSSITVVEDDTVEEPTEAWELTPEIFSGLSQFDGMCHRYVYFTGTLLGNYKNQSGVDVDSFISSNRCTFEVQLGNIVVTVAYNYHVNRGGGTIGDDYKSLLDTLTPGTSQVTIKGTLTWAADSNAWTDTSGEYQIVPWVSSDIAAA